LAALLSALTARILLLLARFLLIGLLLAALLTALAALLTLLALLAALIWIVGHWKRLLIAGWPRKVSTNHGYVGSRQRMELWSIFKANASQGPMKFPEHK
jgi:DMSO/TMAO reductase YedYZ molybdopterin-dependent catalytic subunit